MYKGIFTTDVGRIEKEQTVFANLLQDMEALRREFKQQNIRSIDIYENDNIIASLRTI